jgi:hypothetical protein
MSTRETPGAPLAQGAVARKRWHTVQVLVGSCVVLAAWTVYLAVSLPVHYVAGQWRYAWVGFDVMLLATLSVTAWSGWRRRQAVIPLAVAAAVLLICDAWFDVMLAWGTDSLWMSIASALLAELPLAAYLLNRARRLLILTLRAAWSQAGFPGKPPPLHRVPLFTEQRWPRTAAPGSSPPGRQPDPE